MNGVNPIELVEIPISEFQRDFPNDPDAVQRRFERVDGARRRMLAYVIRDWKQLCASGWEPPRERPKSAKETIVQVSAGAHCTLLELQAQRFRKIETDNWDALNRQLKMELKQAELEQKNKMITKKHEEIQSNNDNAKRERQLMVEKLHREDMERLKKKHEDEAEEIRRLQALDSEAAAQKKIADEQNRLKEKEARERRELERVQREQYTKQLKNSIMSGLQNQTEAKKKVLAIRDKNMEDRIEQARRDRDQMMERRRLEKEQRLAKAKEDQQKQEEEDRLEVHAMRKDYISCTSFCYAHGRTHRHALLSVPFPDAGAHCAKRGEARAPAGAAGQGAQGGQRPQRGRYAGEAHEDQGRHGWRGEREGVPHAGGHSAEGGACAPGAPESAGGAREAEVHQGDQVR
jgi:hypothetical protein